MNWLASREAAKERLPGVTLKVTSPQTPGARNGRQNTAMVDAMNSGDPPGLGFSHRFPGADPRRYCLTTPFGANGTSYQLWVHGRILKTLNERWIGWYTHPALCTTYGKYAAGKGRALQLKELLTRW